MANFKTTTEHITFFDSEFQEINHEQSFEQLPTSLKIPESPSALLAKKKIRELQNKVKETAD